MSNLFLNRVIMWIACWLALPAAAAALPLTGSDASSEPITISAEPDLFQQGSAASVSELVGLGDLRHLGTTLDIPSLAFDVGTIENVLQVRESLMTSAGADDREENLRTIQASASEVKADKKSSSKSTFSQNIEDRPLVIRWIYSLLDVAGLVDPCDDLISNRWSCDKRIATK